MLKEVIRGDGRAQGGGRLAKNVPAGFMLLKVEKICILIQEQAFDLAKENFVSGFQP